MGVEELDDVLPPSLWLDPWEREILNILERMDESVDVVEVEGPNDTVQAESHALQPWEVVNQRGRYDIESLQNIFDSIALGDRRI